MPKIPIDRFSQSEATAALGTGDGLTPETAESLRGLDRVNQRIEREILAASYMLDGTRDLREGARDPGAVDLQFFGNFRQSTERRMFQTLTAAPESVRSVLREDLSALGTALKDKSVTMEGAARAVQRRVRLGALFETFAEIVRNDPTQVESVLSRATAVFDDMALPEDRRTEIGRHVRDLIGNAALDGLLEDPADAQGLLDSGDFDALLTPESLASRKAQVNERVQREKVLAKERTLTDLSEAADSGGLTETVIGDALRAGTLTEFEADFLRAKNEDAFASAARENALVTQALTKNGRLDPGSPDDQAAVDALWKVVGEQISTGKPDEQASREVRFVRNRGVLPTVLRNKYSGLLYSTDPALQVAGARAVAALEKIDPRLIEKFPPEVQDRARAIGEFAEIPLAPDLVVSLAEDRLAKSNQTQAAEEFPEETENSLASASFPEDTEEVVGSEEASSQGIPSDATQAATRPVRTSKEFVEFLEDTFAQPEVVIEQRAREAGLAPDLTRIALSLVSASSASEAGRAEIIERARNDIDALPKERGIPKEQLRKLVDGLGPLLDDRDKTLQAIAANREAFRDRFRQNRDPDKHFRELSGRLAATTGFEARLVAAFTKAEGGLDPTDPRADVAEELPIESGAERPTGLPRVAFFRKGSDTPFMTVPHSVATAVMSDVNPEDVRLDFLDKWLTGGLQGKELEDTFLRAMIPTLSSLEFETAKDAFRIAQDQLAKGMPQNAVLAAIIPTLFPDVLKDSKALEELILDLLPVIGEIRSAKDAVKDIKELEKAVRAGDISAATKFAILSALDVAGAAPLVGGLFRPIKVLSARALRSRVGEKFVRKTPGIKRAHGMLTLPKTRKGIDDFVDRTPPEEMFGHAWRFLNEEEQSLARGIWLYVGGRGIEVELIQRLRNAGFTVIDKFPQLRVATALGDRNFDAIIIEDIGNLFNFLNFPIKFLRSKAKAGEIKRGFATGSALQRNKNVEINNRLQRGKDVPTAGSDKNPSISIGAIRVLRGNLRDVSDENWESLIRQLFKNNVDGTNSTKLREENLERVVRAGTRWLRAVKNATDDGPITVGKGLMAVAIAARAAGVGIDAAHEPEFANDSFSGPMPIGS